MTRRRSRTGTFIEEWEGWRLYVDHEGRFFVEGDIEEEARTLKAAPGGRPAVDHLQAAASGAETSGDVA